MTFSGSTSVTCRWSGEALRLVHPRVDRDDREGAADAGDHDRHAGPEVRPRREPVPAEDVDRDEDRLEEEADPLDREQDAEHLAEAAGELGPQQPELERDHGAGDRADRERHRDHLRPAPREQQRVGVVVAEAAVVGDQHDRRERHAQAREDDVEAERERHLAPRRRELRGEEQPGHGAASGLAILVPVDLRGVRAIQDLRAAVAREVVRAPR
jgi:hypothetical protein